MLLLRFLLERQLLSPCLTDLLWTVKIIAGSTAEIAAASVGDEHLVATVRMAEKSSVETLNGLEVTDVDAEVRAKASVTGKAVSEEPVISDSNTEDVKTEEELEEHTSTHAGEEEATVEAAAGEVEVYVEVPASIAGASEDHAVIEVEDVLEVEEENTLCHEPFATDVEHVEDITTTSVALEEALQTTIQTSEEDTEITLDAEEEAKPAESTEEAVERGNIMMVMPQA
ncbi:uncharacterized protein LOC127651958 isoform X1 [Xyrauchen texanus]|uniref:uncharacterized protein LOC127651958 isoform X1 n=1 Tax=Xyrauchen texanus TaxID=154827 RepID=UPI002241E6AB|nr:uncharacterized protein LOC127651958 isoform X1 [Xyrauchen texanus]